MQRLIIFLIVLIVAQNIYSVRGIAIGDEDAKQSMVVTTTGTSLFFTYHNDKKCENPFYDTLYEKFTDVNGRRQSLAINSCLRQSDFNIRLTCKKGQNYYTILKQTYSKSDTTCATPLLVSETTAATTSSVVFRHDNLCNFDEQNGGYMKIHCGEDSLSESFGAMYSLAAPVLYKNKACSIVQPKKDSTWMDVCHAKYNGKMRGKTIEYNYRLSLKSRYPRLIVLMQKFSSSDLTCTRRIVGQRDLTYREVPSAVTGLPACYEDPLNPGFYYPNTPQTAPRLINTELQALEAIYNAFDVVEYGPINKESLLKGSASGLPANWDFSDSSDGPCGSKVWLGITCTAKKVTKFEWNPMTDNLPLNGYDAYFRGSLASEIGMLTALEVLSIDGLTGTLPSTLARLTKLRELEMCGHKTLNTVRMSGSLSVLTSLTSLRVLSLENHAFTGTLPTQIGKLTNLGQLILKGTSLQGTIPSQLALLPWYRVKDGLTQYGPLILEGNAFTVIPPELCSIPFERMNYVSFASNSISCAPKCMKEFSVAGLVDKTACDADACSAGTYKSGAACVACPATTWSKAGSTAASQCSSCQANYYRSCTGTVCGTTCTACPDGKESKAGAAFSSSDCTSDTPVWHLVFDYYAASDSTCTTIVSKEVNRYGMDVCLPEGTTSYKVDLVDPSNLNWATAQINIRSYTASSSCDGLYSESIMTFSAFSNLISGDNTYSSGSCGTSQTTQLRRSASIDIPSAGSTSLPGMPTGVVASGKSTWYEVQTKYYGDTALENCQSNPLTDRYIRLVAHGTSHCVSSGFESTVIDVIDPTETDASVLSLVRLTYQSANCEAPVTKYQYYSQTSLVQALRPELSSAVCGVTSYSPSERLTTTVYIPGSTAGEDPTVLGAGQQMTKYYASQSQCDANSDKWDSAEISESAVCTSTTTCMSSGATSYYSRTCANAGSVTGSNTPVWYTIYDNYAASDSTCTTIVSKSFSRFGMDVCRRRTSSGTTTSYKVDLVDPSNQDWATAQINERTYSASTSCDGEYSESIKAFSDTIGLGYSSSSCGTSLTSSMRRSASIFIPTAGSTSPPMMLGAGQQITKYYASQSQCSTYPDEWDTANIYEPAVCTSTTTCTLSEGSNPRYYSSACGNA